MRGFKLPQIIFSTQMGHKSTRKRQIYPSSSVFTMLPRRWSAPPRSVAPGFVHLHRAQLIPDKCLLTPSSSLPRRAGRHCHTLKFLDFRMWLKLKINRQFSHSFKILQHFLLFIGNLVKINKVCLNFKKKMKLVACCTHATLALF